MKCKWKECENESRTKSEFCSDTCNKRFRRSRTQPGQTANPDKVGQVPKIQDTPESSIANYGQPNCECQHCINNRANGSKHTLNHGAWKTAADLGDQELNRVSLPGDADYAGV